MARLARPLHASARDLPSFDEAFCIEALEEALSSFGKSAFTNVLHGHGVKISMDGKGDYIDNIFIERLWRSVKHEEVYLHTSESVSSWP